MLIIGAGGLAKQMIEMIEDSTKEPLYFFDDTISAPNTFLNKYPVITSMTAVQDHFDEHGKKFMLAVSGPANREILYNKFLQSGGEPVSLLSNHTTYGRYDQSVGIGSVILSGCQIESSTKIGVGVLINLNVSITHDSMIGDFTELGPGVIICGRSTIGAGCFFGAGAIVLPGVHIGDKSIIGAGAVINKNVKSGEKIMGIPGRSV